jgi:hypothetical protein
VDYYLFITVVVFGDVGEDREVTGGDSDSVPPSNHR